MIWISAALIGAILIKLGAMSVVVTVQSIIIKGIVALFIVLVGVLGWRWSRNRKSNLRLNR